jgi:hypothetical protein
VGRRSAVSLAAPTWHLELAWDGLICPSDLSPLLTLRLARHEGDYNHTNLLALSKSEKLRKPELVHFILYNFQAESKSCNGTWGVPYVGRPT